MASPIRFIVRARDEHDANGALAAFMHSIEGDPDIALEDRIGPPAQPHTVVVSVAPGKAAALEARVHQTPQLLVERDRPLSLF